METREGLRYSQDHEWLKLTGQQATIGISDYAQEALGEVVFVELPAVGAELTRGDVLSVIESVKAASEVYTPVSGRVLEVNAALADKPEGLNEAPYENWLAVVALSNPAELAELMDEAAYRDFCAREGD